MEPYLISYATYVGFILDLLVAEYLFSLQYIRRPHYHRRWWTVTGIQLLTAAFLSHVLVSISTEGLFIHVLEEVISYLLLTVMSLVGLKLCLDERWSVLLLCTVTGYAVQHMQSQICLILWEIYGNSYPYWLLTNTVILLLVYALTYFFVVRRTNEAEKLELANRNVLLLSVATIVMVLVLSCVRDYYQDESPALLILTRIFSIVCCIFLLLIRGGFLMRSRLEQEVATIQQLHYKEREQYEQSRRNIELINIKCHDLKKRLEQYEDRLLGLTREEIEEMKNAISIYDSAVKTGNDTLDTILTERSLRCEQEGITFSCIVDGESLSFLTVGDTYSLFANAIDNAIEAVSQLPGEEERMISLSARRTMGMVTVTVENPCPHGELLFQDGLPKTTRQDANYHGYGMKSIRMIVEKYGGEMSIRTDAMFRLSILFPRGEKPGGKK